jgi:CheY-like chemotaxis protein
MEEKLEVLIVEDSEENITAAKEYFSKMEDFVTVFSDNFEDAMKKLNEHVYAYAIFDMNFPRTKGGIPEKLGNELAKEADSLALQYALMTAGIDHHQCLSAFVKYYDEGENGDVKKRFTPQTLKDYEIKAEGFFELTETPKSSPRSWKLLFERGSYKHSCGLMVASELPAVRASVRSRKDHLKFTGKQFRKTS